MITIIPHVKQVLLSEDGIWIAWVLFEVVSRWSTDLRNLIKDNLLELSSTLDNNLLIEGVDIQSIKLLYSKK